MEKCLKNLTVNLLVDEGADLNIQTMYYRTALDFALRADFLEVAEMLKTAGIKKINNPPYQVPFQVFEFIAQPNFLHTNIVQYFSSNQYKVWPFIKHVLHWIIHCDLFYFWAVLCYLVCSWVFLFIFFYQTWPIALSTSWTEFFRRSNQPPFPSTDASWCFSKLFSFVHMYCHLSWYITTQ